MSEIAVRFWLAINQILRFGVSLSHILLSKGLTYQKQILIRRKRMPGNVSAITSLV